MSFYGQLDQIGMQLEKDFPDWERKPLSLEVRDKELRRRLFVSVKRSFFESCSSTPDENEGAYDAAADAFEKVNERLAVSELSRLGVRQWYALSFNHDMAAMVERLWKRFFAQTDKVKNLLNAAVKDLQYVVDLEDDDGWQCHFRVGPMPKEQWFQWVQYETGIFSPTGIRDYHDSLPDQIIYVDLDYFREKVAIEEGSAVIKDARQRASSVVRNLVEFYQKG